MSHVKSNFGKLSNLSEIKPIQNSHIENEFSKFGFGESFLK
jgi:hypothetical protein